MIKKYGLVVSWHFFPWFTEKAKQINILTFFFNFSTIIQNKLKDNRSIKFIVGIIIYDILIYDKYYIHDIKLIL